jgi:hypothetical protein
MELHLKLLIILPEEAYAIYTSTPKLMSPTDVKTLTSFGEPFPAKACSMTTSPGIPLAADSTSHSVAHQCGQPFAGHGLSYVHRPNPMRGLLNKCVDSFNRRLLTVLK